MDIFVKTWKTERKLVESEGFQYLRLPCPDHCWPPADLIDEFISFANGLEDDSWLHFTVRPDPGGPEHL